MRIFSRRPAGWQRDVPCSRIAPVADMGDPAGTAGERAYGATFIHPSVPGASITVWAFAACNGQDGDVLDRFMVAYRVAYRSGGWTASLFHSDVTGSEWYPSAGWAEDAALTDCTCIVEGGLEFAAEMGIPGRLLEWDGRPW